MRSARDCHIRVLILHFNPGTEQIACISLVAGVLLRHILDTVLYSL